MLRVAVILLIVLCVPPSAAAGAPLRALVDPVDAFATDGERYAVWTAPASPGLTVLDTRTGSRAVVQPPDPGCRLSLSPLGSDEDVRGGRARVACGTHTMTLDLASRVVVPEPAPSRRAACPSLVRRPRALVLVRCGGRTARLDGRHAVGARLGGAVVSWHTGDELPVEGEPPYPRPRDGDRLKAHLLSTGRTLEWPLPWTTYWGGERGDRPGHVGASWHTRHAVFWVALQSIECDTFCEPGLLRVYWSPIGPAAT